MCPMEGACERAGAIDYEVHCFRSTRCAQVRWRLMTLERPQGGGRALAADWSCGDMQGRDWPGRKKQAGDQGKLF